MAAHSSILAWRIPWTEEPGGLQSTGLQRVRHDWATNTYTHTHTHTDTGDIIIIPILQMSKLRLGLSKLAQIYVLVAVGIWAINIPLFWDHF